MGRELYLALEVPSREQGARSSTVRRTVEYCSVLCAPWLRDRILLRDISPRRLCHHPELVETHHGIVPDLELEPRLLFELAQEVRLLLHEVQRHLGVQPHRELALPVLGTRALQGTLHPAHHHLGPEHASRAVAGRALGGHRVT